MKKSKHQAIRENLLNQLMVVMAIIAGPAVTVSVLRSFQIGWQPAFNFQIILVPVIILFAVLRKSIAYHVKTFYVILLSFSVATTTLINFSLNTMGLEYMMLCILITVIFLDRKKALGIFILCLLAIAIIGFFTINGAIAPSIDTATYHTHFYAWASTLVSFAIVMGIVILVIGNIGHLLDVEIIRSKKREKNLKKYQKAIENAGHAIYITDREGSIESVNPAFEQITGYSETEAIGKNPKIFKLS